jgi:hypothetical protein
VKKNMQRTIRQTKANWIGYSLYGRNFLLKRIVEGKLEGNIRCGRRRMQLLDDFKGKKKKLEFERGSTRLHLWGTSFGRGCGPVARTNPVHDWVFS